jgi:hypothetical protein
METQRDAYERRIQSLLSGEGEAEGQRSGGDGRAAGSLQ